MKNLLRFSLFTLLLAMLAVPVTVAQGSGTQLNSQAGFNSTNLYANFDSQYCPNGIISYWNLDEVSGSTYYDSISVNNATSTDAPTPVTGTVSGAQLFNGSSDQMTAPRIAAYDFTAGSSFTFETWIKHPAVSYTTIEQIIGRKAADNLTSIALAFDGSANVSFSVRSSTGEAYIVTSTSNLYDDNWHHIAAVKDGSLNQLRIYIDGVLENTVAATYASGFASPTATLSIGWRSAGDTRYLNATLDELAIYNTNLSSDFISMHYNNGLLNKGYCAATAPSITSNPVTTTAIGQIWLYNVDASGYPVPTYSLTTSPVGMTINSTTGLIEWIPASAGDYDVIVTASNGVDPDATQAFVLTVALTSDCLNGVVNYWKLDETSGSTYTDYAGINNATSTDQPTAVTGKVAGAQQFNGSSDQITASQIAAYDFAASSSFTFETWIKHPATSYTTVEQIIGRKAADNLTSIALAFDGSANVTFSVRSSTGESYLVTSTSSLYDANWHHVVGVKDGTLNQLRIYVDGELENTVSATYASGFDSPTATMSIGWRNPGDGRYLNGTIDELAIYNTSLSAALISQHYNNGLQNGGYCYSAIAPTITSSALLSGEVGQLYSYDVDANGIPTPVYSLTTSPSVMTINSTSGLIQWTPTASGNFDVTVQASNGVNPDAAQSFVIAVAEAPICPSGIVSYWKLNETTGSTYVDYINANNGVSTNAPSSVSGRVDGGQLFNGTSNGITAPRIAAYDFAVNSSFTFEAWIKHPVGAATAEELFLTRKATDNSLSLWLGFDVSTSVGFSVKSQTGQTFTATGTSNLYDNNWHHVVGVKDGSSNQLRVFVDGNLEKTVSATYSSGFASPTATVGIGWRNITGQEIYFNGSVDEVAIYDVALSANSILQHYANGLQNMGYCSVPEAPAITSSAVTSGNVGQLYSYDVESTGSPVPTYSLITFPGGMTINAVTGVIEWIPTSTGDYNVTVNASNGVNPDASQSFTINVAGAPPCPVGILNYWKLDEAIGNTFADNMGVNDATSADRPTAVNGVVGGAQRFNGTSDQMTAPRIAAYDFAANSSFTFETWIKHPVNTPVAVEQVMGCKATDNQTSIALAFETSTNISFSVRSSTGESYSVASTSSLYDDNWHHVVAVKDGSLNQLRIYVDGVLENTVSAAFASGFASPTATISIGWRDPGDPRYLNARIDELAIYNTALNAVLISQHYNNGFHSLGYCNIAPAITSSPVLSGAATQLYSYVVAATGTPAPAFSLTAFPVGMTINSTSGLIQWTPSSAGNYDVTVKAANGVDPDATQSFTINVTADPPCPVGIINYWKLDETSGNPFVDYMGLNNATSSDLPTAVVGLVGGAQRFNGTSDQMTAPRIAAYDFAASSSFTFEAWIKLPPTTPTSVQQVIGRKAADNQTSIALAFESSTNISFSVRSSSGESFSVASSSSLFNDTENWHHVVAIKDGTLNQLKIYVDGVLENTVAATYTSGFASPTATISIGWRDPGDTRYFSGRIDELAIYDVALDDAEILAHYNNGLQGVGYCYTNIVPTITSVPAKFGAVSQPYTYDVNAAGIPAPTYSLTTFPSGMTINSTTGLIEWTPTSSSIYDVTVVASNGFGPNSVQSFRIFVQSQPNIAPVITSTPITTGIVGQLYSYDVDASGLPAPVYSLTTFPSGMTINSSTGVIEWTPTATGNFNVTVKAANGVNPDATQSFTVSVNIPPVITSTPLTTGVVGQLYSYDVNATGTPVPTYSLTAFPSGMIINSTSGLVEWTPAAAGDFNVTVAATNGINPDATQSFTINVQQPLFAPTNLEAVLNPVDTQHVKLTWIDNSSNELGFVIERRTGDTLSVEPFLVLDSVVTDVTSFDDTTVSDTTTYTYRVYAFNADTTSDYSNIAQIKTPVPVELTSFIAAISNRNVVLDWETATELNNAGFSVQRSKGNEKFLDLIFIKGNGTTTNKSIYSYTDKSVLSGNYAYRLKQVDFDGSVSYSKTINVELETVDDFVLEQNYPNPFNPSTTIRFGLPKIAKVTLKLHNTIGQEVVTILDKELNAGVYETNFDASKLSSGVYFYELNAIGADGSIFKTTKRMILMK